MSRFLIACGGTGGHLAPGIALAEGLVARGHEAHLLISRKQVDARLSQKYPQLSFARVPAAPLGAHPAALARFVWHQSAGIVFSWRYLRQIRPDVVIGFGGFTSVAVVLAGWMRHVPVALHEANRVPGRAVRLLARFAQRVYLPPGVRLRRLHANVARAQGLPVRAEFQRMPRAAAFAALNLQPARRLLAVLGGSQGAAALNDWAERNLEALALDGVQVFCVSGPGQRSTHEERLRRTREGMQVKSYFVPFCDQMPALLSAADLVVSRAGAGTLAELARVGTPGVLVPFPGAADDHQAANARFFEQQGGGLVVDQRYLGGLIKEVQDVIGNDWLLRKFRENLHRMDQENSLTAMLNDLERLPRTRPTAPPRIALKLA